MKTAYRSKFQDSVKSLRRMLFLLPAGVMLLAGCGKDVGKDEPEQVSGKIEREQVSLTVWGAQEDAELLERMARSFEEA